MDDTVIINKTEMALVLDRLLAQVIERNPVIDDLVLIGIQRRGADIATRLAKSLELKTGKKIRSGTLDINLYRDDWTSLSGGMPHIGTSSIPCDLDGCKVILIDDVLFSGRTIRAALEALLDYGRPACVELLVLVDRGHRELPICADYVGRKIGTKKSDHVDVLLQERDGRDAVCLKQA